jgi:hypothetical protein
MYAPRCPSIDAKYAASAPTSLRALWIFCPNPGSLIAAFPASTGISIFIRNRILVSLLVQSLFDQVLEYPHSIRNNPWHGRGVSGHVRLVDIGSTLTPNDAIDQSDDILIQTERVEWRTFALSENDRQCDNRAGAVDSNEATRRLLRELKGLRFVGPSVCKTNGEWGQLKRNNLSANPYGRTMRVAGELKADYSYRPSGARAYFSSCRPTLFYYSRLSSAELHLR